ncbi:SCO family protein [Hymenobacter glacialis]|uniref:SCO family protein n=1 Tax=Hymenobacter glacialis TaxID=1908236 RepID=UPI001F4DF842|nr:SCO family protein [Hymenobacter glacialis]
MAASLFTSCTEPGSDTAARLPILGERDVRPRADGGPADTIFATVPAFKLTDQSGKVITNQTFAGKAYIADFFFATCPGICPKMQAELLKVYAKYGQDPRLAFLSHTIDPAHDTIPVLRDYADRLGMGAAKNWYFATTGAKGEPTAKDSVFQLARAYYTAAEPDKQAPGGFAHNGTFALVDDQGHIRGLYDSLNEQEVARLMTELPILLDEIKSRQPAVARQ